MIKMASEAKALTGSNNLCMAGGAALNCVPNGKIHNSKIFDAVFIQPAAGDAGGALGAAQAAYYLYLGQERTVSSTSVDAMDGSYLDPEFSDLEIELSLRKYKAVATPSESFNALCKTISQRLAEGNVIGWMQGRMEFGPRALGADRS